MHISIKHLNQSMEVQTDLQLLRKNMEVYIKEYDSAE